MRKPTLREERVLLRSGHRWVAGMDEVGRGALAGPVSVGVVLVGASTRSAPPGLRDSKLLTPLARERIAPRLRRWAVTWGVGHASPAEIDRIGIISALRLAGRRALDHLDIWPDVVILDGSHDWLSPPRQPALFDDAAQEDPVPPIDLGGPLHFAPPPRPSAPEVWQDRDCPPVQLLVKADLRCAAVAAASVLAKTTRDAMMLDHARQFPGYDWAENKGYCAPSHVEALSRLGPCELHRRSWRLPGMMDPVGVHAEDVAG